MSEVVPEYLKVLQLQYPGFTEDGIIFANIGMKINKHVSTEVHTEAVVSQCRVAWEVFNSIHCLVAFDYGLCAMSLCRNLFELVVGTIYLIDHPTKVQDFLDYGKTVAYELAAAMKADQPYLDALKEKSDYDTLKKRFGGRKWHGTNIKGLAQAAGMDALYESFYKETSSISHGDSFITLGYRNGAWGLLQDVHTWSSYCETSLAFSFLLAANLYHRTVHGLELPYVRDVQAMMGRLMARGLITL